MKLKISEVKPNPKNPRLIKDDNFKKLVDSLKVLPIMLDKRPILIDEDNMIIGGNMRYKAAYQAGMKQVPVERFTRDDADTNNKVAKEFDPKYVDKTYEQQRDEMIIKDNVSGGDWDWDALANDWNSKDLDEWGLSLPGDFQENNDNELPDEPENMAAIAVVAYENIEDLDKITDFYVLESVPLTKEMKEDINRSGKAYVFKK